MHVKKGVKLQFAISFLVLMAILLTIGISWFSSAQALKESLKDNYLESNQKYANRLSLSTSDVLTYMQQNINSLGKILGHQSFRQADLDEWRMANSRHFNSLFITDEDGVIQLMSPEIVEFKDKVKVKSGRKIQSDTVKKALSTKKPFISEPYLATSGQLIMLISAPIFDDENHYRGLIGGTIYLESEGAISHILNEDTFSDGSYVFVVDRNGHILYHPDSNRLNEDVSDNKVVQSVLQGKSGSLQITNSKGKEFFAGYAYEDITGWGIVSQTPTSVINVPLSTLLDKVISQSFPLLLIILLTAWYFTNSLAKPLNTLARFSEAAIAQKKTLDHTQTLKSKSYIYEVRQLYHHFQNHLNLLNNQLQIDGLTGLVNRRTLDLTLKAWLEKRVPFSVIMIDIDLFKKVNDTYGHLVGDDVLKFLAVIMKETADDSDICFRYGGEEFGVLVKSADHIDAFDLAEQLRLKVCNTLCPTGEFVTISLGISSHQEGDKHPETILKRADDALYQSKSEGRNKTVVFEDKSKYAS
jgi:diguanylate cyclase (GGDEF)-like protein